MRRSLALCALAVACSSESQIAEVQKELAISPPVSDLGTVVLGETVDFQVQLDNLRGGDISVRAVSVTPIQGEGFEVVAFPDIVAAGGTELVDLRFTAGEAGWIRAAVSVTSDAQEGDESVEVRAHAGEPRLQAWPMVLDFGLVDVGASSTTTLTLAASGDVDTTVESITAADAAYHADPGTLTLTSGETAGIEVTFAPTTGDAADSTLEVLSDAGMLSIALRGNSCESGAGVDQDEDGFTSCAGDCDDHDPRIHPAAAETWDGEDEDCDGAIDEGTEGSDDDGDGFSEADGDCHDGDTAISPAATEEENGRDDDCDGVMDDGAGNDDVDGDGWADWAGDCEPADADVHPGAAESTDGKDNDCDGTIDEGTSACDDDGDGVTEGGGDCDDTSASTFPSATEVEDHVDNDCDGTVDEGTDRFDDDSDGYTEDGGDCDDADSAVNPRATETSGDGKDNDCDGSVS